MRNNLIQREVEPLHSALGGGGDLQAAGMSCPTAVSEFAWGSGQSHCSDEDGALEQGYRFQSPEEMMTKKYRQSLGGAGD